MCVSTGDTSDSTWCGNPGEATLLFWHGPFTGFRGYKNAAKPRLAFEGTGAPEELPEGR